MKNLYKILFLIATVVVVGCDEDTIDIEQKGSVSGTVTGEVSGEPLEGVKITTNPASTTVFTDNDGFFFLDDILVDDYSVQAELDSFVTAFEGVTVTEDAISNVTFELSISDSNNTAPSAPVLVFPEDGAQNVPVEVTFVWSSMDPNANDDVFYSLELRNTSTNDIALFGEVTDTTLTVSTLNLSTNYFWQVTADDNVNPPVASSLSEFTTFSIPDNPFLFVKEIAGNNVIFSGSDDPADDPDNEDNPVDGADFNVLQITDDAFNSLRPRRNNDVNKIAFLRTVGPDTQLFLMDLDGTNVEQLTSNIPVTGFRLDQIDFAWAADGSKIYYPNFDKIFQINLDGSGNTEVFVTTDGSFVSEIAAPAFDTNVLAVKTNNAQGYETRIFTVNLTTELEELVVLDGEDGASGGIDFSANADKVLYTIDLSGSENSNYRIFESRMFIYDLNSMSTDEVDTDSAPGMNELDAQFSPTEGFIVYTLVGNSDNATPSIFGFQLNQNNQEDLLFTNATMADWE